MKKYLFFAASALALAGCSSDDYLGNNPGNTQSGNTAIQFGGETGKMTRADHVGSDAASLLNKHFIVAGYKSGAEAPTSGISTNLVFDHYNVEWTENTAGTTADNTADWAYVGKDKSVLSNSSSQTIKYWDYSAAQYDYVAFSIGSKTGVKSSPESPVESEDGKVVLTPVTPETASKAPTKEENGTVSGGAYTITGTATDLSGCYIADLVTAYKAKNDYNKQVNLKFRNLTSKARVAFYETIPGYSVKNLMFHVSDGDIKDKTDNSQEKDISVATQSKATLYTTETTDNDYIFTKGTAGIYFPTVGSGETDKSDYNKAHVVFFPTTKEKTLEFDNVTYYNDGKLGTTSKEPSYAGLDASNHYKTVIPNETGTTLTLCVDYTLVSDDGSKEEIHVYGAKAIIPAIYAAWKSNYAYTYIFKISDNTNGWTSKDGQQAGLYPITFDAVVADAEDGNQSTITTVATPSITTYQVGHKPQADEYYTGKDIYVKVMDGQTLKSDLSTNAAIYTLAKTGNVPVSEATVHDALTIGVNKEEAKAETVTGRNGITLTKGTLKTDITAIPGVDGNNIPVTTAGSAASFTPSANTTYAFVYKTKDGEDGTFVSTYTATETKTVATGTYFTDKDCTNDAGTTLTAGTTYYYKVNKNTNTYAVKIIKVAK